MMLFLGEFHLLRSWWLLALFALPFFWRALRRNVGAARAWSRAVDAQLLPHLLVGAERSMRLPLALLFGGWTIAVLAVAGPSWEPLPAPLYRNQAALVVALELAPTMLAADIKPDRLTRARYKIRDLLERVGDGQVALLGYAGEAFVVAPLTDDAATVEALLDALDPSVMPVPGNATELAIRRASDLIHQAGQASGRVVVIADAVSDAAVTAAKAAKDEGVTVSVLALGTAQGAPVSLPGGGFLKDAQGDIVVPKLEVAPLRALAAAGGGHYAELASDGRDLDALLAGTPAAVRSDALPTNAVAVAFRDRGPWLLWLALPFVALAFRRGWLMALVLATALPGAPAQASTWSDLWQRHDQQAWSALDGDAKTAQSLARDPALRGAAAYRAGDFAAAEQHFGALAGADAQYNRGNALAKAGRYEEALAAYDNALKTDPQHADAKANRDAVADWFKRKQNEDKQKPSPQDQHADSPQSQPQDGSGQPQDQQQQDSQDSQQHQPDQKSNAPKPQDSKEGKNKESDAQQSGEDAAKQQFREQIDRELEKQDDNPEGDLKRMKPAETEPEREKRQAMEQWLERVPDDPGGLLRRKFQLEYERRQSRGERGGQ